MDGMLMDGWMVGYPLLSGAMYSLVVASLYQADACFSFEWAVKMGSWKAV